MRRPAYYSSSSPSRPMPPDSAAPDGLCTQPAPPTAADAAPTRPARRRISQIHLLWAVLLLMAALLATSVFIAQRTPTRRITQDDIDAAVLHTLQTKNMPSAVARAADNVAPSVVRVVGYGKGKGDKEETERGVGTGVVIVDKGTILTNLHVVQGADRVSVTFADGLESPAHIVNVQPQNDLAVLQAHKIPDDLVAATLRSTDNLRPGEAVAAVGFPFGIGPSVSAGVVSGLKREFQSPEGRRQLSNLIQFDAAANPGNSGGPLITMDGEVVGIVTAILNPTQARTFIGIGFAVPIENAASAVGMSPF
ncbi:trypsin-like peptidase domain-containing protein [Ramlibacter sp. H39-3-26]|uniref:S1C family serine protease n=1 Tax=Curvibacter soli TaxID=3031331 RepID=UPI0023DA551E|nr:trypsin-like peptidase domain-containing protein [Ramlibacter sp. H39-3-26]MDF1483626.1 trypsin-like peptidase domain-containing protein [Ramlibacter sp. H39-3-26]